MIGVVDKLLNVLGGKSCAGSKNITKMDLER